MRSNRRFGARGAAALGLLLAATGTGCATRSYVDGEAARLQDELEVQQVPAPDGFDVVLDGYERAVERQLAAALEMSQLAVERAAEAERLASGEVPPEPVFTVGGLYFASGSAELNGETRAQLDQLAERLRIENLRSYLEIYGHPDGTGQGAGDLRLAGRRAEAVRRYLHTEGGIPLHHLAVSPRGGGAAAAVDGSPEAPESGHRVVVVVLR
jgi:outer membrane protein OmpA-like peptidoglycan-associated protein